MMENVGEVKVQSDQQARPRVIVAGDVGATKSLLGVFEARPDRPHAVAVRAYATRAWASASAMLAAFVAEAGLGGTRIDAACLGVAGPVVDDAASLTNVPWRVTAREVAEAVGAGSSALLNDLAAMAYAVGVLAPSELHVVQAGRSAAGNRALIAAGTGLGQALLHDVGGRLVPVPSEAGHADFAARTEREIVVLRHLTDRYGRAEVEHVLSGPGLLNLHRVTHAGPCLAVDVDADGEAPAAVTAAALARRCQGCIDALQIFVDVYGAEAGNLALRAMATGGVFLGGGIAPKILPALTDGRFLRAFLDKGSMRPLLEPLPIAIILNPEAGLLGAAVRAAQLG